MIENETNDSKHANEWKEFFRFALIIVIIIIPIRIFIAQPFVVSGASMEPTFENGDYLIVDEISKRFKSFERGDVVIFKYPEDPKRSFIKRIIGLPNETVSIENGLVTIINKDNPEGFALSEPYLIFHSNESIKKTLSDHEYFVLGDNRPKSSDSRFWGALPDNLIQGKPFLRLLPIEMIGVSPGKHSFSTSTENR